MSKRSTRRTCEICGIREAHLENHLFFANFPLDENRCREWVRVTGNSDLVHLPIEKLHTIKHVCGRHFKTKDMNKNGNRLKKRAVPCLQLSSTPLNDYEMSGFPLHMANTQDSRNPSSSNEETRQTKAGCSIVVGSGSLEHKMQDSQKPSTSRQETEQTEAACSSVLSDSLQQKIQENNEKPQEEQDAIYTKPENITKRVKRKHLNEEDEENVAIPKKIREAYTKPEKTDAQDVNRNRESWNYEDLTPRKKKLVKKLKKTRCTLQSLRRSSILLEKIESPVLKELIINACQNEKRKPKARRWTTQHKLSCLAILKRSQKTYRYLSAAVPLPTIKTLQNVLKKVPMAPGLNQSVLNHLKTIADGKDEKDRMCSLAFDEMAIKSRLIYNEASDQVEGYQDLGHLERSSELADHALVFMLQGLKRKFKQPIAFYFTKGTISSAKLAMIIKKIIIEIRACGFDVINTTCDQGPTNMGALKILRESSGPYEDGSHHYFQIEGKKVCIMYDIPHLFKSIRNNFLKAGSVVLNNKRAKWDHLVEMETHNENFLYLSKISEAHVNPKYKAKMRVKLAAQLLSNTVAAVLKLLARAEREENKANELLQTAHVVEELDQLFDCTNGPSGPTDIKKTKRENVSEKSNHMDRWAYYIKILQDMKFINKYGVASKNVRCVEGFITSLKSLRDIWATVKSMGYKYFNLRNVNQDALENLFGVIRQHSPTNRNPTASHFIGAIKTSVVTGLTAPHSRGANCEKDDKHLLTNFQNVLFEEPTTNNPILENEVQDNEAVEENEVHEEDNEENIPEFLSIPDFEEELTESDFSVISKQPIVYIAGYLAKHILKKVDCNDCKIRLTVQDPGDNPIYSYILLREWWQNKFSLIYPTRSFCKTVETLVAITERDIVPILHEPNICLQGCTMYDCSVGTDPCFLCPTHGKDVKNICFNITCKLFIRRQCQRINQSLASKEEDLASISKRAEQQGKAK